MKSKVKIGKSFTSICRYVLQKDKQARVLARVTPVVELQTQATSDQVQQVLPNIHDSQPRT